MNLSHLTDSNLLANIKQLIQQERSLVTKILHHLREVERRKLFSDLGHSSLFEYCVKELGLSEGQTHRRIQAMRLIKEIPEIEKKISSGKLNLSNISKAQSFFRQSPRTKPIKKARKREILQKLENQSARQGEKILLEMLPEMPLPQEKQKPLTGQHTEIRLVLTRDQKENLNKVRALLGPVAANMNMAELIEKMSAICIETLEAKRFGKKRMQAARSATNKIEVLAAKQSTAITHRNYKTNEPALATSQVTPRQRIPRSVQCQVWMRDRGECANCQSCRNVQFDHIKPIALGGTNEAGNIRLLCHHCNQRQAIHTHGDLQLHLLGGRAKRASDH